MLRTTWSDEALDDLAEIVAYISERNEPAARRLRALITETAERIRARRRMYRPARTPDTREAVVHPNYIIVYRIADKTIDILAVLHARQQYP